MNSRGKICFRDSLTGRACRKKKNSSQVRAVCRRVGKSMKRPSFVMESLQELDCRQKFDTKQAKKLHF